MIHRTLLTVLGTIAIAAMAAPALAGESFNQPTPAPKPATPVTLPADPRISSATPELRGLLEERKREAGNLCVIENNASRPGPVYECECYSDRVVIATLDEGPTIYRGGPGATVKVTPSLQPPAQLVSPRTDLHTCFVPFALPKRGYEIGTQLTGMVTGDSKKKQLAQCIADGAMAAHKAKPAQNIQGFDNLARNAYGGCMAEVN